MQSASLANDTPSSENISEWHRYALEEICSVLLETSIANSTSIEQIKLESLSAWSKGLPIEPLELFCKLEEPDDLQIPAIIEHHSLSLANAYSANILPAPFASLMVTPSSFYEKHSPIYEMAKSLKCPILFNEDADVIGLGSINPITATVFSQAVIAYVSETLGIKPFVSKVRLTYKGWNQLCEKHFSR